MGEIKSTWDIVMEKTKGLEISSKEKEQIKRAEVTSRVHAIFNRYMDAKGNEKYLRADLGGLREEVREAVERGLLVQLMDSIDLSKDNGKAIAGIKALKGKRIAKIVEEIRLLASEYNASREKKAREIEEAFRQKLAAMGILGSAVQPSLEGKRKWIEVVEGLQRDYGNRLEALKEELLSS